MKEKWNIWLPILLMAVFAFTRWPGLGLPLNFSASYALVFCAGVYFPRRVRWWLPLATMVATDLIINLFYYHVRPFTWMQLANYAAYAVMIWLGTRFTARSSWLKLLAGGIFGAILFYLITNTAAWFFNPYRNPEYAKNFTGWLIALTKGTAGWPQTWEFFRNTLLSGGLFTGLFAGAMKVSEALESAREKGESEEESDAGEEAEPRESEA